MFGDRKHGRNFFAFSKPLAAEIDHAFVNIAQVLDAPSLLQWWHLKAMCLGMLH